MDPRARVVVTPSDHHYRDTESLTSAISAAVCQTATVPLTLVGAEAERAETEFGWIEAGKILKGRVRRIEGFVEKPSAPRARELFRSGGLWNTFVMIAEGRRLWRMAEERMPVPAALIRAGFAQGGARGPCLARAYDQIEEANFSRAVLEDTSDLGVVCARRCGFSDWGSPERIFESLRGTPEMDRLLARLSPDLRIDRRLSSIPEIARSGPRSETNELAFCASKDLSHESEDDDRQELSMASLSCGAAARPSRD
jgi:mannose-1-phosphate guanylyltransferase